MMDFDEATTWQTEEGRCSHEVSEDWMQGRAAFGGLLTAAAVRQMRALVEPKRTPRIINTHFYSPGRGRLSLDAQVVRSGRFLTSTEARITHDESVVATVTASFGEKRSSEIELSQPPRPELPDPETLPDFPYIPGVTPEMTRNFIYRLTDGALPFSGASEAVVGGWCRFRKSPASSIEAVVALLDAWPSPVLAMAKAPIPASTISWSAYLYDIPPSMPEGWWWFRSEASDCSGGYATVRGLLYRPDGVLAARMEQLEAVFG